MRLVRVAWIFIALYFIIWGWILWRVPRTQAQQPQSRAAAATEVPAGLSDVVKEQFGACFQMARERTAATVKYLHPQAGPPWISFLAADLDGDGVEDAVIVARCKTPLADQMAFHYKVVDPYYTNYGYGNPKVTAQFNTEDPDRQNLVLVIHGSGKDAWRATTPKAKFVIINLPFDSLSLTQVTHKKRVIPALNLIESEKLTSAVYWDGKAWKWMDTGGMQ